MNAARTERADTPSRIMIVDDHPTVREGLGHCIESQPDMTVCGEAADVKEAVALIDQCRPDVVIVDIALKSSNGLELIKTLKSKGKQVRTIVHSMYDESVYANRSLQAGAMGYVNKEAKSDEVIHAIRTVCAGRVYVSPAMTNEIVGRSVSGTAPMADPVSTLTNRQLEIFRLIGEGLTPGEIARRLHISIHTVETHRENIKRKLKVGSVTELARRAVLWVSSTQ